MAEENQNEEENSGSTTPDLSFIPDTFKAEDGSYKVDDFASHFSELSEFKTAADERAAALPTEATAYALAVPEDHQFIEGFNPADHQIPVLNDEGEPVLNEDGTPQTRDMTAADMIDADDPDLPALQEAMLEHKADPALMGKIASIMANRELRALMDAGKEAKEQKAKLGPEAPQRIAAITRTVEGVLPSAQAKAVLDSITSADALQGIEALIQKSKIPPNTGQTQGFDLEGATNKQLIAEGLRRQMKAS